MPQSRRNLLIGGLAIAGGYAALRFGPPAVAGLFTGDFDFEPIERPAGFRRIAGGDSSSGFDLFMGLDDAPDPEMTATVERVERRICETLYGSETEPGVVRVASFSDYNCPYCRALTIRLSKIEAASEGGVRIAWHELPLLGEASTMAAQAALAAKRQGAYVAFHKHLMRTPFGTTPEYLEVLAEDIGVDGARLLTDMASEDVRRELRESSALADIFAFVGTPALVVGRTVVQGEIGEARLRSLIERERADGPIEACA
ncbi:DsbA family protein [uncultured Jannaschia sp.]|uniref:DsbA family protein n=1 Tax=uncultured Jannaschia sp. TaxID=293347 RepID=UPI00262A98B2|nr:DsbA family protein [uncultured Jannaschia sp.]